MRYKNRKIANPLLILIRLFCYPALILLAWLVWFFTAAGWGIDEANRVFNSIEI